MAGSIDGPRGSPGGACGGAPSAWRAPSVDRAGPAPLRDGEMWRMMRRSSWRRVMKYVLLGRLDAEWAGKQKERVKKAQAKLKELGIYTQGPFDFVDVVDAPNPEAMLSFSVWYAAQGFGRIESLPAFDAPTFEAAVQRAGV